MEEFKVGDEIIIKGKPTQWNSSLNGNCPWDRQNPVTYPFRCKIEAKGVRHWPNAISAGNYGWSLNSLIQDNLVELAEPEFVLPEKWCVLRNDLNGDIINKWFIDNRYGRPWKKQWYLWISDHENDYISTITRPTNRTLITFEQFQQYVMNPQPVIKSVKVFEPLPQFQIVKTIGGSLMTIVECINNEGSTFEINDAVSMLSGTKFMIPKFRNIIRFKYNRDKTDICAVFDEKYPNGVRISKLQHYIKPKVVEPIEVPETLLEKAIRLFPIGMKFKSTFGAIDVIKELPTLHIRDEIYANSEGQYNRSLHNRGIWAEPLGMESSLEKAIRLYPIGTKFRSQYNSRNTDIVKTLPYMSGNDVAIDCEIESGRVLFQNSSKRWSTIIND